MADLLSVSRTALYLRDEPISASEARAFDERVERRAVGEPVQYIVGWAEFCGARLRVDPRVLIPRPETEAVVSAVVEAAARRPGPLRILDAGTGSGAIAIALAHQVSDCHVVGGELSWGALQVAAANITAHRMTNRITLVRTDWTLGLRGPFDVIVSNPPYVPARRLAGLPADVQREPRLALDGGLDGMAAHRRLLDDAPRLLARRGLLAVECEPDQAAALSESAQSQAWVRRVRVIRDLADRPRAVFIESLDQWERATA